MEQRPVVIVSNRGPLSFRTGEGGDLVATRGAGGLVSGIAPLVTGTDATWIAAAMTDGDRTAADGGVVEAEGFRVGMLDIDPETFRQAYDVVCNATLWFLHHGLYELARRPRFDTRFREAWASYREVNRAFADAVAASAPDGAAVLVQDYHLALVGSLLADSRPDLRTVHFSHTPFASPDLWRVLPTDLGAELLAGMAGHHACGFHSRRWAAAFEACCEEQLGRTPTTFVAPLAPDAADIGAVAAGAACGVALTDLDAALGDRAFIVRVDRIELSKNILRGFIAFEDLLERYPEWRERAVFGAFVYPSREGLPEYLAYRQEVEATVRRINQRWATPGWTPVMLDPSDDFPRSVAALRRADVLLVNPIRDGLNLVAEEGALVNDRDAVLLLSPEAGVWDQLAGVARPVHPYDISGTADALADALAASPEQRAVEAAELRRRASARTPRDWLDDQLPRRRLTFSRRPGQATARPRRWRRSRACAGPSTIRSPTDSSSAGISAERTTIRATWVPFAANRSRAAKAARSPTSSPKNATESRPTARRSTTTPLSVSTGGCSSNDIFASRTTSPDRRACSTAHRRTSSAASGCSRKCRVTDSPLFSTSIPPGPFTPAPATSATASRHTPDRGSSDRSPRTTDSSPYSPESTTAEGEGTKRSRNDTGRPDTTATRANRSASASRAGTTPGRGTAASGDSTIGARVPSKSVNTPAAAGRSAKGRRTAGSAEPIGSGG